MAAFLTGDASKLDPVATNRLRSSFSKLPAFEPGLSQKAASSGLPNSSTTPPLLSLGVILGIVGGIGVAFSLYQARLFDYVAYRLSWPQNGLVVYANPTRYQARLETLDKSKVLLASSDAYGALSLRNLPSGTYRVILSSPGCKTIVEAIQIAPKGPTIVGFPNRIDLPKRSAENL